jgi:hypothetical protein
LSATKPPNGADGTFTRVDARFVGAPSFKSWPRMRCQKILGNAERMVILANKALIDEYRLDRTQTREVSSAQERHQRR